MNLCSILLYESNQDKKSKNLDDFFYPKTDWNPFAYRALQAAIPGAPLEVRGALFAAANELVTSCNSALQPPPTPQVPTQADVNLSIVTSHEEISRLLVSRPRASRPEVMHPADGPVVGVVGGLPIREADTAQMFGGGGGGGGEGGGN